MIHGLWRRLWRILEGKYRRIITYEDPPFVYVNELVDETAPAYRAADPNGYRALRPKGGALAIKYQELPGYLKGEIKPLIQQILRCVCRIKLPQTVSRARERASISYHSNTVQRPRWDDGEPEVYSGYTYYFS